jgi:hypothetical protein
MLQPPVGRSWAERGHGELSLGIRFTEIDRADLY